MPENPRLLNLGMNGIGYKNFAFYTKGDQPGRKSFFV
jgi:hypothetical protein